METGELSAGEAGDRLAGLALSSQELREAATLALELKAAGYPILASRAYLELLAADPLLSAYTCRAPRARLTVGADGIDPRLHARRPSARRTCAISGRTIRAWRRCSARPAGAGWGPRPRRCTKCNNPDVIELSWLWDLRPVMLGKVLDLARR